MEFFSIYGNDPGKPLIYKKFLKAEYNLNWLKYRQAPIGRKLQQFIGKKKGCGDGSMGQLKPNNFWFLKMAACQPHLNGTDPTKSHPLDPCIS